MNKFTKKQTSKNIILAGGQIVASGLTLFILYKYLINTIGIDLIGVWSIVMAFSAFLRTGDFGFAGSIVKFVSAAETLKDDQKVLDVIYTSFVSAGLALFVLLCISYPLITIFLPKFIGEEYIDLAQALLPYSLISIWFAVLGTLIIFVFDGLNRVDIRSIFLVFFNIILVFSSILFVHLYGFIGLGYAQVLQAFLMLICAWWMVRKALHIEKILPIAWHKETFKEIFSYSIHLQLSSLVAMMLEPVAKLFLGHFGTLSNVAYFDMANRLVMQVRNVVVNANQALVPMLSKFHTEERDLKGMFFKTLKVLMIISIIIYPLLVLFAANISSIWIGDIQIEFINDVYIITVALGINTLAGAAYFTNMGTGDVKFNTYSQAIIAGFNIVLSFILGNLYYGDGVIWGYAISIILGSLWLIYNFYTRKIQC